MRIYFGWMAASAALSMAAGAATLTIENQTLSVTYDDVAGSFTAVERASGAVFLKKGKLEGSPLKARVEGVRDAVFGGGDGIRVANADGSLAWLELYPGLPFLLIRSVRLNPTTEAVDLTQVAPATFTVDLGKPAGELKTMGTGGLTAPDQNPGSYLFLTVAEPATRRGVVAGWLTEDRGSGVLFSSVKAGAIELKARIDYGHLLVPAGSPRNSRV